MTSEPRPVAPSAELAGIRLLSCDIDGVLTDGGLYYADDGTRIARFHVLDGMGLQRLQRSGVKIAFISQSRTAYIANRARDLGVDYCFTGIEDKHAKMLQIVAELGIGLEQVCHIADDVNDMSLLASAGVTVTVPGGMPQVKAACRFITTAPGGQGAVRELCEAILASQAKAQAG